MRTMQQSAVTAPRLRNVSLLQPVPGWIGNDKDAVEWQ